MITTIGMRGIDVLEPESEVPSSALEEKFAEEVEVGAPHLTPSTVEKTDDPVRIYLREMGTVPLLTRQEEVDIAKRIERGQLSVLKALSRSPLVIQQILVIGEDLKRGIRASRKSWFSMRMRSPRRPCRTASTTLHIASTSCRSITQTPTGCPEGYR